MERKEYMLDTYLMINTNTRTFRMCSNSIIDENSKNSITKIK